MRRRIIDLLACPICRQPLRLHVERQETRPRVMDRSVKPCRLYCEWVCRSLADPGIRHSAYINCPTCYRYEITKGQLSCEQGHRFSIVAGVPRLFPPTVDKQRTKKTFDVEWNVFQYHDKIYGHSRKEEFLDLLQRMVVDRSFFNDKTVLDAGCGIGRITGSVAEHADEIVGIDFSDGVDEAYWRNRDRHNVHIIQGDIMTLPFRESAFDYVYSKGVIHYVSDPKQCLAMLSTVVVPGGALSITIYGRMSKWFERFNRVLRKMTLHLPLWVVFLLSHLLVPFLIVAWRWSGVRKRKIEWNERAHMIFNWLSSEFQNRSTNDTAAKWFYELGFDNLRFSEIPVGILGIKKK